MTASTGSSPRAASPRSANASARLTRQRASPKAAATPVAARFAGSSAPVVTDSAATAQPPITKSSQLSGCGRPKRPMTIASTASEANPVATAWNASGAPKLCAAAHARATASSAEATR